MPHPDDHGQSPRSVRSYIDETPNWADGTPASDTPLTTMQKRIWLLAAAGKFFEGLVVFMTGIALPLIQREFGLDAVRSGIVGAASLFGILIGALTLGHLADRFGRKTIFVVEMAVFCAFLVLLVLTPGFTWLVVFLFGMGVALGGDYPTAHLIISESIPTRIRGRAVLGAFSFQALGALAGTGIGYLILANIPHIGAWRLMYAVAVLPAFAVVIGRLAVTESPAWLLLRGHHIGANDAVAKLLRRAPPYPRHILLAATEATERTGRIRRLFSGEIRRATVLASLPWFLQDIGTYGIGIFTPTILARTLGHDKSYPTNISDVIGQEIAAAKGAALLDVLLIVGILAAIFLSDRTGRIPLQIAGFIGCAVGLTLAGISNAVTETGQSLMLFSGFMIFNFMTNMGPNAQTYLIAGEVFPAHLRGLGSGFAASVAKLGAVITVFLFPIVLQSIGTELLLAILIGTSLLGAAITWWFRIETKDLELDDVD